jgi:ribonuclease P/MRP protein subunit POP5
MEIAIYLLLDSVHMPSKAHREKTRYIAFRIDAPRNITRKEFIGAIRLGAQDQKQWDEMKPWLTVFEDNCGILRCFYLSKDDAVKLLKSITHIGREKVPISVITLGTSGSIKKAKSKFLSVSP